jgi:hypothetical protein
VSTGEGKSIILAMLALYFVLKKGKKVHILVNNAVLGERDKKFYAPLYDKFRKGEKGGEYRSLKVVAIGAAFEEGDELHWKYPKTGVTGRVTVSRAHDDGTYDITTTAAPELKVPQKDLSWPPSDVDVTYTPLYELKKNYMDHLMKGKSGRNTDKVMGDTVLLVDEVDDIIVGPDGMSVWGVAAQKESKELQDAYAGSGTGKRWNDEKEKHRKAALKARAKDTVVEIVGEGWYPADKRGKPDKTRKHTDECMWLNYRDSEKHNLPPIATPDKNGALPL